MVKLIFLDFQPRNIHILFLCLFIHLTILDSSTITVITALMKFPIGPLQRRIQKLATHLSDCNEIRTHNHLVRK